MISPEEITNLPDEFKTAFREIAEIIHQAHAKGDETIRRAGELKLKGELTAGQDMFVYSHVWHLLLDGR